MAPQASGDLAVTAVHTGVAAAPATRLLLPVEEVVLAVLDVFGVEETGDLVASGVFIEPLAHRRVHIALDLYALVPEGRVVESLKDIVDDLVHGYVGILPGEENAAAAKAG